ncbi:MAG: Hsp20/alpha crystallin family protein [Candidatus Obscuribacterales bacterium]
MKGATLEKQSDSKNKSELRKRNLPFPLSDLRGEMIRLFDEFVHIPSQTPRYKVWTELESDFHARVDMKDNDGEIVVTVELPGVKLEDIDITVNTDYLRIEGEKKEEKEEKEKGQYRLERSYGSFIRQLPLPCEIEREKVEASFSDGVLRIVLPKSKSCLMEERKVSVKKG